MLQSRVKMKSKHSANPCLEVPDVPKIEFLSVFKKGSIWTCFDLERMSMERITVRQGKDGGILEERVDEIFLDAHGDVEWAKWSLRNKIWDTRYTRLDRDRPVLSLGPLGQGGSIASVVWAITGVQQKIILARAEISRINLLQKEARKQRAIRLERFDARRKKYALPAASSPEITVLTVEPSYVRSKRRFQNSEWFHISGSITRSRCAVGPISFERRAFCTVVELQIEVARLV